LKRELILNKNIVEDNKNYMEGLEERNRVLNEEMILQREVIKKLEGRIKHLETNNK